MANPEVDQQQDWVDVPVRQSAAAATPGAVAAPPAQPGGGDAGDWVDVGMPGENQVDNPANQYRYSSNGIPVFLAPKAGQGFGHDLVEEGIKNPARQVVAGAYGASAEANGLTANIGDLMDRGWRATGGEVPEGHETVFKRLHDWAWKNKGEQEAEAQKWNGGRQDFWSQLWRGITQGALDLPTYAVAAKMGGPIAGFATLNAIKESDQGFPAALRAAAQGALTAGALEVMGPAERWIRLSGAAAMTYAQAKLNGADNTTALAHATTMGLMSGTSPGGAGLREIRAVMPGLPDFMPRVPSHLNPVQQRAIDYLRQNDVPVKVGTATGNKWARSIEALVEHSPLGAADADAFNRSTEQGLQGLSTRLADKAHRGPATPESAGHDVGRELGSVIEELQHERDTAYKAAWSMRDNPAATKSVPVRTERGEGVGKTGLVDPTGRPVSARNNQPRAVMAKVNMPVDIRAIKAAAEPVAEEMGWTLTPSDQASSAGFHALQRLLKSEDYVPAWQAEHALSGLKSMARVQRASGVRNESQGVAASLISELQDAVDNAVHEHGGPEALEGLRSGRKLHAHVEDVANLVDTLFPKGEDVQAYKRLTWRGDSGINFMREIAKRAPESMPKIGRAFLDHLHRLATQEGGFARAKTLANEWEALGDETKAELFPDKNVRRELDNFFLGAKLVGQDINSSGTALVQSAGSMNPLRWAAGWLGGKLLYTPGGQRMLLDPRYQRRPSGATWPPRPGPGGDNGPQRRPVESGPPSGGAAPNARPFDAAPPAPAESSAQDNIGLKSEPQSDILPTGASNDAGGQANNAAREPGNGAGPAASAPSGTGPTAGDRTTATSIPVPGSGRAPYQSTYAVRELADLRASHNGLSFAANEKYELANDRDYTKSENQSKILNWSMPNQFDPRFFINNNPDMGSGPPAIDSQGNALGGNGRTMMLQRTYAYNPKGAQAYRDLLMQDAQFYGLDPAEIAKMKQPVLVREIPDSEFAAAAAKQTAITDFNAKGTAALRPAEQMMADSRRVSGRTLGDISERMDALGEGATLAKVLSGPGGIDVLNHMIRDEAISPQEAAAYVSEGNITPAGKARISQALLGRFFRDPAQIDRTPPAIRGKLERIAAPLANVEGDEKWSLTPVVQGALDLLEQAKGSATLDDFLNQRGLLSSEQYPARVVDVAKQLKSTSGNILARAVQIYSQDAAADGAEAGMFGKPAVPAPGESLKRGVAVAKLEARIRAAEKELLVPGQSGATLEAGRAVLLKLKAALEQL